MSEQFSILIDSRTRFETSEPGGVWLSMPTTKEQLQPRVDKRTREVEAESVAYTVCQHYGLDTSDYSFGYVAGWSSGRELSELKSSLETIRSAAAEIINSIDETLAELSKAQDMEQTAGQEQPDKEETAAPEQPKQEAPAQEKAAFTPETIYRVRRNPYSDSKDNTYLLQAYVTQENGRAKMSAVLFTGTPQKCRELMGQLKSGELTEGQVKELYAKAQETAKTAEQDKDTYSIYQLKHGDETRDLRFEPYDRLQVTGNVVDKANYELIYSAELTPGTSLEDIYTRFNIDHGYVITGYKLIKNLQAWLLPFVFNIRKVARGNVHFVAYFLAAFISACPRCFYGLPESCKVIQRYWSFCHNNSPNYILLFLSLLGYAYTVPTISQNNSYYCRIKTY